MSSNEKSNKLELCPDLDVICMTSGKSGSTTLLQTFRQSGYKTYKFHSKEDFSIRFPNDNLIDLIKRSSKNKKLYLIDSYRTPIERKISASFYHASENNANWQKYFTKKKPLDFENASIEMLIDYFNCNTMDIMEEYQSIEPIMKELSVPEFSSFNFKKKYAIREQGNLVFIKILFSDIENWGSILSEIFKKPIKIIRDNTQKEERYNVLKKQYKIKKRLLEKVKKDKYFILYTSPENRKKYYEKWNKRLID